MSRLVDLSHPVEDEMPGFRMTGPDDETVELSASVGPFMTREETAPQYAEGVSFELSEVAFQANVGTYLDAPAHRYAGERDVGDLDLDELVMDGVVVDAREYGAGDPVGPEILDDLDVEGLAVLFEFGWDAFWGTERYRDYPFLSGALAERLVEEGASLVGVDAINVDDADDPARPVHSTLLADGVLVVENLRNLEAVRGERFRLFAVPLRVPGATSMPVRAFAAVE